MRDADLKVDLSDPVSEARPWSITLRYALAIAAVALTTTFKLQAGPWLPDNANALYLGAVALTVWKVGLGPGVFALALSAVSQAFFFAAPLGSLRVQKPTDLVGLVIWIIEGSLLCALFFTAKRRAARAERAEGVLRLIFEMSPGPMFVFDTGTLRFLAVNEAALELYGYTRTEFLLLTLPDLKMPDSQSDLRDVGSREDWSGSVPHRKKDGTVVNVEISARALMFQGRHARIATAKDVTERQHLEQQLRHAQKMEAVGRLAGGVAHDFNNMLNILLGYTVMLLDDIPDTHPMHGPLSEMKRAGERSADLTRQLLAFSRQQPQEVQLLDVNETVANVEKLARRVVGEDVEVVTHLSPEACNVNVDPGQLEQVIMNMVVNARDAMPDGGKLTLETYLVTCGETYVAHHNDVKPGQYAMLAISDSGVGMDLSTQTRIFEPFFTTKDVGKGTGLGLSIVFGIVHQYGGHVWVYSEAGKGTTFKVYLPIASEQANQSVVPHSIPFSSDGSETILLVEDEDQVRRFVGEVLRRSGYRVLAARHPGEAVLLAEQHAGEIDLLLTDVIMPHASGRQLADQLLAKYPSMRVVYMSGYTDNVALDHGVSSGFAFLQKPVAPHTLSRKVRAVLDSTGVAS
jgi:two-component system, cell cycle sensor histidine kinase and response regulator CckA